MCSDGGFSRIATSLLLLSLSMTAAAEVVFDTGESRSGVMIIDAVDGVTRGNNLLHSFETFHVRSGESATFTGPDTLARIIARVTGGAASEIRGRLASSITDADLFLVNPNGVVFGEGAVVDVDGAFVTSTARNIRFADDSVLVISESGASGFSAAAPAAFGFDTTPATVAFIDAALSAATGSRMASLDVTAARVEFDGATLDLEGTDVELLATTGATEVPVDGIGRNGMFGDIVIRNGSRLDTSGDPAGAVAIGAGTLALATDSFLFADSTGATPGSGVTIALADTLSLDEGSRITTDALADGTGGTIEVTATNILLTGTNTKIATDTRSSTGSGGLISLDADRITLDDGAQISAVTSGAGAAGDLDIRAEHIELASGAAITAETRGTGDGGNISIDATERLSVSGFGTTVSSSTLRSTGNAGVLAISTAVLDLADEATLEVASRFPLAGAPGRLVIDAGSVTISGLATISSANASLLAAGGDITIRANTISASGADALAPELDFSGIRSETFGDFAGGNIDLQAGEVTLADGGTVLALTESLGAAGTISLTGSITLQGGAIDARTLGEGPGGSIRLNGDVTVTAGGRVDTSTPLDFTGVGDAGNIEVHGTRLAVSEGGRIASRTDGAGRAGAIEIASVDVHVSTSGRIDTGTTSPDPGAGSAGTITLDSTRITLDTGGQIASNTNGPAPGGSLDLTADRIHVDTGARISVSATGSGDAGDITVLGSDVNVFDDGAIATDAAQSGGGSIAIRANHRVHVRDATVTASSGGPEAGADGGNLVIGTQPTASATARPILLILHDARIVAQAVRGNGGTINLYAGDFLADVDSIVSATSELGNDGEVTIASPDNGITGAISTLTPHFARDSALLDDRCAAAALADRSSLVVTGRSVLPAPDDYGVHLDGCAAPAR